MDDFMADWNAVEHRVVALRTAGAAETGVILLPASAAGYLLILVLMNTRRLRQPFSPSPIKPPSTTV